MKFLCASVWLISVWLISNPPLWIGNIGFGNWQHFHTGNIQHRLKPAAHIAFLDGIFEGFT